MPKTKPKDKDKDTDSLTTVFFIRKMPRNLMYAFKASCVLRGITMKDKVISMIRDWLKEHSPK